LLVLRTQQAFIALLEVMNRSITLRAILSLTLVFAMLSPTAAFAFGDGKKHFKAGMKHEVAEEWDKAAEEFALAVAENPKNPEYKLHLTRALFNASQMYMKKGTMAANEKDYEAGYISFRKAYAFDPTNELAKSEMARMVRLQEEKNAAESGGTGTSVNGVKLVPTGYGSTKPPVVIPQKLEKYRDVPFPGGVDLQFIIKELARELDLNVLFETATFRQPRKTFIDLKNVTAARALDYIFLQEGLFFQKVGPQTILVAGTNERTKFQQLVLRTFYLANAAPKDIAKVVQTAIPAQPGRSQTIVLTDDATNSVTIRDTEENIRLIGQLIRSLDKDRAEVVMDVAIYEVNKNDLLQWGNQLGGASTLLNIGGAGIGVQRAGDSGLITGGLPFRGLNASAVAFGLPISSIAALQSKGNTKLVASTQIHAFNNEDSSARIGQRVPVQSAQIVTGGVTGQPTGGNNGFVSNVVNYEQVGLTLKFKPLVFPNQDVQVAMEIESKDVATGGTFENPIFTERTIKGTARIQNNKTLLLASVAQNSESNTRTGIPFLGLIPVLGRLFTAPRKDNSQIDIVIAVTPRVIRAPAILPEDEIERPTGSVAVPTSSSLEAMVIEDEQAEILAAARRTPTNVELQLPDQPATPAYVRTSTTSSPAPATTTGTTAVSTAPATQLPAPALVPIDSSVKTLQLKETSESAEPAPLKTVEPAAGGPSAEVRLNAAATSMKAGEKSRIAVQLNGEGTFSSATIGVKFDARKFAVRSITLGEAFGDAANRVVTPFLNQSGKAYFSITADAGKTAAASGVIAYLEVEALADGAPEFSVDGDIVSVLTADGKPYSIRIGR
jgi:general secretion pathway protein D